jgi:hypothetical protein
MVDGELRVEPQRLRQLAGKTADLAGQVDGAARHLQVDAGPERIERAAGNYAGYFPVGDAADLLRAMRSVAGSLSGGYAPVLSSAADALARSDAVSAEDLGTARSDFTLGA